MNPQSRGGSRILCQREGTDPPGDFAKISKKEEKTVKMKNKSCAQIHRKGPLLFLNSRTLALKSTRISDHSGGSKGGRKGHPRGSKFFHFHAVFSPKNRLAHPLWDLAPLRKNLDLSRDYDERHGI